MRRKSVQQGPQVRLAMLRRVKDHGESHEVEIRFAALVLLNLRQTAWAQPEYLSCQWHHRRDCCPWLPASGAPGEQALREPRPTSVG
mmetsp:Transcript_79219/g.110066  ORF Transcript_79219/g.110066 Transcript_79219/m.110066 type:complete len:87 (+) Transcript_79219:206-466(+)